MGKNQKHEISKDCGMQSPNSKKKKKGHVFLEGGGQRSFSLRESSQMLFQRDYQQLYTFDGTQKIGVAPKPQNPNEPKLRRTIIKSNKPVFL